MSLTAATYSDAVFNVKNLDEAKRIILTQEVNASSEQRWQQETPYIVDLITSNVALSPESLVLDFGCGVGRIPKELISATGCRCVGVDTSVSMLALGLSYVSSDRYLAVSPEMLRYLDLKFDLVLSVWALQHVRHLEREINDLTRFMPHKGKLFIVNEKTRFIPTAEGHWADDGQNIRKLLEKYFFLVSEGTLSPSATAKGQPERCFWAVYEHLM